MTNFENMKKKVLDMISSLDEEEFKRLIRDTCMDEGGTEGVFSCAVCEKSYGSCDATPDGNACMKKYLDWCSREYSDKSDPAYGWENKKDILMRLKILLTATREGSGIKDLALSGDERIVTIHFSQGSRSVNVEADSGCAMIMDIVKALL